MGSYKYDDMSFARPYNLQRLVGKNGHKLHWFMQRGYQPHAFQMAFHFDTMPDGNLTRWRSLVAGRRGGKTLSAAWEMAYYVLNPDKYHEQVHGKKSDDELWWWFLAKTHKVGFAGLHTFRWVMKRTGLIVNKDYKENRGHGYFEFKDGSRIDLRSAQDPDDLVGAGLDGLWIDEAAKIETIEPWDIVRPALSDKLGIGIFTTTPTGKNWLYDEFHSPEAEADKTIGRIEYRSLDNPYFPRDEWETVKKKYHPMMFKREFMASFDAFAGKELQGDWLHYYEWKDVPMRKDKSPDLDYYIGIDPAISLSDKADHFALTVVGVTSNRGQVYIIEQVKTRIDFPDQLDLINEMNLKYRPLGIGIESTAYQRALAQQAVRLESVPMIQDIPARGNKVSRILSMSPMFKVGRVLLRKDASDFIDEWIDYDSELKNPKDDMLDSTEIALRTAGILLMDAVEPPKKVAHTMDEQWQEFLKNDIEHLSQPEMYLIDPDMGEEY